MILASGSPQRKAILEQLGLDFRVVVPGVEERSAGDPGEVVAENALRKARAVEGDRVLAADTAVVYDGVDPGKASRRGGGGALPAQALRPHPRGDERDRGA